MVLVLHTEEINGLTVRYIDIEDEERVYLLPFIPIGYPVRHECYVDLEGIVKDEFPQVHQERVKKIADKYVGRQLDTTSILLYAEEMGRFDEFAERLESKPKDFAYIHPNLMMARTDVTAFFMQMYADLGIAPREEADEIRKMVEDYGPGIVVSPKDEGKIK